MEMLFQVLFFLTLNLAGDFISFAIFGYLKWVWMKKVGISEKDRLSIYSNREKGFSLLDLEESYTDRKLIILDGICRKGNHFIFGLKSIILLTVINQDPLIASVTILIHYIILSPLFFLLRKTNCFYLSMLFFGATARIRDGIYGRTNIVTAMLIGLVGFVWVFFLIIILDKLNFSDVIILRILQISFLPVIVGDALGEVIGSLWGKQKIRVWGVGEINRKSWEGTSFVFIGSLIPILLVIAFYQLNYQWLILGCFISILTPIVELLSPRSTDNFTISFLNTLTSSLFVYYFIV